MVVEVICNGVFDFIEKLFLVEMVLVRVCESLVVMK